MARRSYSASSYSSGSKKSSSTKSSTKSSTPSGGGRQSYSASSYTSSNVSGAAVKKARDSFQKSVGESKLQNYQVPKSNIPGMFGAVLNLFQGARQKSFEVNRDYFLQNVAGKRGYGTTFDEYKRYITGRSEGKLDAMGRPIQSTGGDRRTITQVQKQAVAQAPAGPTTSETSLATSAYDTERTAAQDTILTKRKGRKQTILTDAQGLGGSTEVSKKKLLG
tara:strand:+ start:1858 stop:2520 length:663 start_codon:yes stop_codon:yes gene_type:complete